MEYEITRPFLKMTAHDATDATISSAMTACTMGLASSTKVQIDRSLPIAPLQIGNHAALPEDDRPRRDGRHHQQRNDRLHDGTRIEHQGPDRQVIAHCATPDRKSRGPS